MENKNEEVRELDLEQMEKVSGGVIDVRQYSHVCRKCSQTFDDYRKWLKHRRKCDPNFRG